MLKYILSICQFFLVVAMGYAQIEKPVTWSATYERNPTKPEEVKILVTANIDKGWHLYSQIIDGVGPVPTTFSFTKSTDYELVGKTKEPKPIVEFDKNFDIEVGHFDTKVTFEQKVKLKTLDKTIIFKGEVEYMVCNDQKCLPPTTVDFSVEIPSLEPNKETKDTAKTEQTSTVSKEKKTTDTLPATTTFNFLEKLENIDLDYSKLEPGCGSGVVQVIDRSFWGIFLAGFIGGLLALLTPCVFPMIPLTVSFFTKQKKGKVLYNVSIYALSIIFIYVSLGFIVTKLFGSDALNDMASNVWFNLSFFIIFLIFAISFFGAFEITLPSKWVNKADSASERGGLVGIFFMAFTLALVSFSCTGPIIGTLLVEAAVGGSNMGPLFGMTGFAVALAFPFALFAAFPGWLKSLPKSGGWLNTVKVVLGFIELALALKFFSNVDLAYHWGLLTREVFVALWIAIFVLLGLYLLGKIKLSHDAPENHTSIPRLLFATLIFAFVVYLLPGMWGAPLKIISGLTPPEFYKEWLDKNSSHCPHNLNCFHDLEAGMKYAQANNKPVMLDFTGWSCVNCRKMEDNVWSDPEVLKRLSNDYVLISLYVDDKTKLPENEQYVSEFSGKKIKTIGNKWSDFQARVFTTNSQPYYVLIDNKGKLLAQPIGYTPNIKEYIKFLDEGLCRNKNRIKSASTKD